MIARSGPPHSLGIPGILPNEYFQFKVDIDMNTSVPHSPFEKLTVEKSSYNAGQERMEGTSS